MNNSGTDINTNTFAPRHTVAPDQTARLPGLSKGMHVIVIGAGSFGGWSALWLLRQGLQVTLVDAWGGGNSRSSSGDETRVIRSTYGANETYFDLNVRALELWREHQQWFGKQVFFNEGVLWLCYNKSTPMVDDSIPFALRHGVPYEYLSQQQLSDQYPLVRSSDIHHAYLDRSGGYLKAREATIAVQELFIKEGGTYLQDRVNVPEAESGSLKKITLGSGRNLSGDVYLFACGSWMGQMFPDVLGNVITCTRQEVFYFGTPAGSGYDQLPVWVDVDGRDFYYGIPGNAGRGFKVGVDIRGDVFEPTSGDHTYSPEVLSKARNFLAHRFPGLVNAPLLESRVCPYENSPDGNFVFDVHPAAGNVLFLGGGSGHGFKHGPALGELVADVLTGRRQRPTLFALSR
ncbi:FAD-dependent oxidoreductase [Chryseolinea sp. T2]|uniref:NAD(P)/FAD-dependent oxidoreductase n=1 Tax=Chryseolinea sp. T2 TaxID=3129255 RepID=UPI0030786CA3